MRRGVVVVVALFALTGCALGDQDEAGSTTGPSVILHCAAQGKRLGATPVGDTTTVVRCPGSAP